MGNCPAGTLNDEENDVMEADASGWRSMNDNVSSSRKKKYACPKGYQLWPDGIIPYQIDHSLDYNRGRIQQAMKTIEKYSRFRFVKKSNQKPFLKISQQYGCYFANQNCDRPQISLGVGCESYRTILHELLHALGFPHEQKRPDRDKYVIIHGENIRQGEQSQFEKLDYDEYQWIDLPFDYKSVMLYSSYAFSKNGRRTIETKDGREIHENSDLSAIDIKKLRRL
ncbi:unnamed protein product [Larinioides sclopetarius]|uniref:Metalloendopeptidase n=1 Tax=Larinioides sclopetarius TaxID=280406 RepID=A0AAV1Z391_9ARAC